MTGGGAAVCKAEKGLKGEKKDRTLIYACPYLRLETSKGVIQRSLLKRTTQLINSMQTSQRDGHTCCLIVLTQPLEKNKWIDKKSVTFANSVVRCDFGEQLLYIELNKHK